jgi:hypothetical protein
VQSIEGRMRSTILVLALLLCAGWGTLCAQVKVIVPALTLKAGSNVQIPVNVGDLAKENVTSFEFVVVCDTVIIRFTGVEQTGTLSNGLMMFANTKVAPYGPGKMKVVCASAKPLSGKGVLVYLKGTLQSRQGSSPLQLTNFVFNAGTPVPKITNGAAKVESASIDAQRKTKISGSADTLAHSK